jgi:hypothetical protein
MIHSTYWNVLPKSKVLTRSILSDRDVTIQLKTKSDSLSVLQINLNTDAFFAEQTGRIRLEVQRKQKHVQQQSGNYSPAPEDEDGQKAQEHLYANIALNTRTASPLNNEQDVDAYLARLKKQLMEKIDNGYSVTIIK